jgi:nucleoid-associated protein EbfC
MGDTFDFMKLMRQAGKLQEKMSEKQSEMKNKIYEADAGAGMVRVSVNGMFEAQAIKVEDGAIEDLGLPAVLELIVGAMNAAIKKAQDDAKGNMMGMFQNMVS